MKRSAPLVRRTKLSPVSARRRGELARYGIERKAFLAERPRCEVCNTAPARDVHHAHGRTGSAYLDRSTWFAVCRPCHDWIHRNPSTARAFGLLA